MTNLVAGIVIGFAGAFVLYHGWGWVLAKYHSWTGR